MFVFGVCVESPHTFDRYCLPSIATHGGSDATLMSSPDLPVAKVYNDVLDACLDVEGIDAIVLLHDDVEIVDPHFRRRVVDAFDHDPRLGVIGVSGPGVGARWSRDPGGPLPTPPSDTTNTGVPVDYVDAACLILRPDFAARFRFDADTFSGRTGFEVDFCHRAREQGWNVVVDTLGLASHSEGADPAVAYRRAAAVWQGRRARSVSLGTLERHVAQAEGTHERPERFGTIPPGTVDDTFTSHHRRLLDVIPSDAGRILQLGCGTGTFARRLAVERGALVTGVDHEGPHLDEARRHLHQVVAADLNQRITLPAGLGRFDAIVAIDILDRLVDPEATLAQLTPHLAPDGVVLAGIPNIRHWSVVLPLLLHDRFEYRDAGLLHRGSIHHFTMTEAMAMFRRLGLGRIDTGGAEQIPLHDPSHLDTLVDCLAAYGTDPEEARTMLEVYEYVITARRV